jgi:processive 1,2-diacylglycerol beta-glucosyltransferase
VPVRSASRGSGGHAPTVAGEPELILTAVDGCRRVLIVTADIGAGHDLPARLLADGLLARWPGSEVTIVDGLAEMGPIVLAVIRRGSETILQRLRPLFDAQYWLIARCGATRRLMSRLSRLVGGPRLLRLAERVAPDVIVSTYPGTTEILGALRCEGRLDVPVVSAITDLAALRYWAHPGVDLHLVIHAESAAEVAEIAGPQARVRHVRGLSRPEFEDPPTAADARRALGLPDAPLVLVSGGGWAIGDLAQAAAVALEIPGVTVACLCGSNAAVRARLRERFEREPRVRVEGFTERMCEWLAAAAVLVHSTAGLTVLEAQMCGTWAISYGWGVGHIRVNNRAYARFGLADVAATPGELRAALRRRLAAARPADRSFATLPAAPDAVLELIDARRRRAG